MPWSQIFHSDDNQQIFSHCPQCDSQNRVDRRLSGELVECGTCKEPFNAPLFSRRFGYRTVLHKGGKRRWLWWVVLLYLSLIHI